MLINEGANVLARAFQDVSASVIGFIPHIVAALIILALGWLVGAIFGRIVAQIVRALKVDGALRAAGVEEMLGRGGFSLNSGAFLGGLVKWFVIVVFLVASLDVLGLQQVNIFLQGVVLLYLPEVIVAVLILLFAAVIADLTQNVVVGSARAAGMTSANFLGGVTKWAIWIFAILTALVQLHVAEAFLQTLFTGVVVALSLGFGLAFGLGGQDAASKYIEKMRKEMSHRGGQ